MNKLAAIALPLAVLACVSTPSYAASITTTFGVTVNLTPVCKVNSGGYTDVTYNYTSFQTTTAPAVLTGSAWTIGCTTGAVVTVKLDNGSGAQGSATQSYTDAALVNSSPYTLTLSTNGWTGAATAQVLSMSASAIAANLAGGNCTTSSCTETHTRTLYINY